MAGATVRVGMGVGEAGVGDVPVVGRGLGIVVVDTGVGAWGDAW